MMRRIRKCHRRGFSLLEVVLALAILAGSFIALGQLVFIGMRSATSCRDLTNAQLLAESVMAEVLAGAIEPAAVSGVTIELAPDWQYSIELLPTEDEYLLSLEVTVARETARGITSFTLSRWMRDPSLTPPDETDTSI